MNKKKNYNEKCKLNWRGRGNIYVRSNFYFQFIYELLSNIFLIFSGTFMFLITLQCLRLKMPFQLIITLPNRIHYCYQMTVAYIYISSECLCNMTHKMLRMFICVLKQNPYANRFFFWNIWNALFSSLVSVMWCSIFFSLCLSVRRLTFVLTELFTKNKWFIWQIFSPHDKRFQSQPSSTRRLFCRFVFCHVIFFYSLLPSFWMCDYKLWAPYIVGFYRYNDNNSHEILTWQTFLMAASRFIVLHKLI